MQEAIEAFFKKNNNKYAIPKKGSASNLLNLINGHLQVDIERKEGFQVKYNRQKKLNRVKEICRMLLIESGTIQ